MTTTDLKELLDYIIKNNSWKEMSYYNCSRKQPKYLDVKVWFTLDTRDGIVFYLKTRSSGQDKSFRVENKKDLEKVYKWLDEVKSKRMELEVGMYVRTKYGITQFKEYETSKGKLLCMPLMNDRFVNIEDIIRASHNIIDLIEVGDYVNGYKVSFKDNDYETFVQCDYPVQCGTTNHYRFYEKSIYSIVTKEQFESMKYEVSEK